MMQTNLYIDGMAGIVSSGHNGTLNAGDEPDYKTYIPDAGLRRRMSRLIITYFFLSFFCGVWLLLAGFGCIQILLLLWFFHLQQYMLFLVNFLYANRVHLIV